MLTFSLTICVIWKNITYFMVIEYFFLIAYISFYMQIDGCLVQFYNDKGG